MTNDEDDIALSESFLLDDFGPLPIDNQSKGFSPGLAPSWSSDKITPATPDNFICLRNCRHYLEIVSEFDHGNAPGSLDRVPMQVNRFCTKVAGSYIDNTENTIFSCNAWDPIPEQELVQIKTNRDAYYEKHPEHRPKGDE